MGEIHPRYMVLQQKNGVLQDEWIVPPVHMFPKCIIFSFLLHRMISQLIFIDFPSILLLHCHFWLVVSNMNGLWLSILELAQPGLIISCMRLASTLQGFRKPARPQGSTVLSTTWSCHRVVPDRMLKGRVANFGFTAPCLFLPQRHNVRWP